MSKKSASIPVGIALLAGLSAQAQVQPHEMPGFHEEKIEVSADILEEMIGDGQGHSGPFRYLANQ